jgi:hypothetical protein
MFSSIGLDKENNCTNRAACDCVKKAIWDAWGSTFRNDYLSWERLCENCTSAEWKDPKTAVCRRKALLAVLASTEVSVVEMDLTKSISDKTVSQQIQLRLKNGDIDSDPGRIIHWNATLGSGSSWLSLSRPNGSVHSAESVADLVAKADGAGLGDTATTGPLKTTLTFHSSAVLMNRSDFINGTDQQTITVRLSIFAKPYVNETLVTITRSSGDPVGPVEPIEAGDKLTVSIKAVDFEGMPISRPDLQLRLELWGSLNKNHSIPLQLKADGTSVYTANISETWVREQETVQSDAYGLCSFALWQLPCSPALSRGGPRRVSDPSACRGPRSSGWWSPVACRAPLSMSCIRGR